jgi:hypothetical protein
MFLCFYVKKIVPVDMALAPHMLLSALRTVTYARGAGKVGFSRTDRLHRIGWKRFAPVLGKTTIVHKYDRAQNPTFAPYLRTSFSVLESYSSLL